MTGSLTVELFYADIPNSPVIRSVIAGAEISVLIYGQVAFTGTIDARTGQGKGKHKGKHQHSQGKDAHALNDKNLAGVDRSGKNPAGAGVHTYADAESYKIVIEARGKAKRLVDSSHDHPTGQMSNTTVPQIFNTLTKNFNVQVNNTSNDSLQIERAVFRDGAAVYSELHRWAREHNLLTFEAPNGQLNLTVDSAGGSGEPLILGMNILSFDCTQSDNQDNKTVTIKGQRSGIPYHGKQAVMNKIVITNPAVSDYSPVIHQLNADASPQRLKSRSKYEADRATQQGKKITIDVFSVQSTTGEPWDLNITHYVQIPPEGIYSEFVVDELTYFVEAKGVLKTELKLVPTASGGGGTGGGSGSSVATSDAQAYGNAQAAQAGLVFIAGMYPAPWTCPAITSVLSMGGSNDDDVIAAPPFTPLPAFVAPAPAVVPQPSILPDGDDDVTASSVIALLGTWDNAIYIVNNWPGGDLPINGTFPFIPNTTNTNSYGVDVHLQIMDIDAASLPLFNFDGSTITSGSLTASAEYMVRRLSASYLLMMSSGGGSFPSTLDGGGI